MQLKLLLLVFLVLMVVSMTEAKKTATIEVLFVVDNAAFRRDKTLNRQADLVRIYYSVFQGVKTKLEAMKLKSYQLDVKLTGLIIAKTPAESEFTEVPETKINDKRIGSYQALDTFILWVQKNKGRIPKHHVAVMFSGYKMEDVPGGTYIGKICTDKAVSVVQEAGQYAMIDQATHEIAHQLGADEDGIKNDCKMIDQYIMAPQRAYRSAENEANFESFSHCSLENIEEKFNKLAKNSSFCLLPQKGSRPIDISSYVKEPVGKYITLDQQCKMFFGTQSFYCAGAGEVEEKLCEEMQCWNAKRAICDLEVRMWPDNGTPCGNKKLCKDRKCVRDSKGIQMKDTCVYGDYKGFWDLYPRNMTCAQLEKDRPSLCYNADYKQKCCQSCSLIKQKYSGIKECEYGDMMVGCRLTDCARWGASCCVTCRHRASSCSSRDEFPWCKYVQASDCYDMDNACCQSCKKLKSPSKIYNCKYGDKEGWCEGLVKKDPSLCKSASVKDSCCESCQQNKKSG